MAVDSAVPEAAKRPCTALVLSGGGARGAYQVGVLQGLIEQGFISGGRADFDIFVGSSAGSINSTMLAAYADRFAQGVSALGKVWQELTADNVFRTDIGTIGRTGVRWAWDLTFGGATRNVQAKSLLDTAPLRKFLKSKIPFGRIEPNVQSGALRALAVPTTELDTANGVLFVHGQPDLPSWTRRRWRIERTRIQIDHIMASSAIPIFFPTVEIDGYHYSDGSIRNTAPLSHAINLGADRIVAVAVREPSRPSAPPKPKAKSKPPSIAEIAGVLLDAVMLDAIEVDVEHSERVNRSVLSFPTPEAGAPFRFVDVLWLSPSQDFGSIAAEMEDRIPTIVRYLMRGLGSDEAVREIASYLLFDREFCSRLFEMGRADVIAERERIGAFFGPGGGGGRSAG